MGRGLGQGLGVGGIQGRLALLRLLFGDLLALLFLGDERIAFERDVLFPLARLDPAVTEEYYAVQALVEGLAARLGREPGGDER